MQSAGRLEELSEKIKQMDYDQLQELKIKISLSNADSKLKQQLYKECEARENFLSFLNDRIEQAGCVDGDLDDIQ